MVYSGIQNIAIPADFDGVFLNVVTQQHDTTEFSGWDLNPFFGGLGIANSPDFRLGHLSNPSLCCRRAVDGEGGVVVLCL